MEGLFRYINALVVALISLFSPIGSVVMCALLFIAIDFVTGVAASRREALGEGREWYFSSREAWRTVRKCGFVVVSIAMMWLVESAILNFVDLHLTRLFAGVICGVEMWSFLENASVLSDERLFTLLRRYVRRRVEREVGDE